MRRSLAMVGTLLLCASAGLSAQAMRNVPRISIDELKPLIEQGSVLVLDVRRPDEFAQGHIPGAVNLDYTLVAAQGCSLQGRDAAHRRLLRVCQRDDRGPRRGGPGRAGDHRREGAEGRLGRVGGTRRTDREVTSARAVCARLRLAQLELPREPSTWLRHEDLMEKAAGIGDGALQADRLVIRHATYNTPAWCVVTKRTGHRLLHAVPLQRVQVPPR